MRVSIEINFTQVSKVNGRQFIPGAGLHIANLNTGSLPGGTYTYVLSGKNTYSINKMVLLK